MYNIFSKLSFSLMKIQINKADNNSKEKHPNPGKKLTTSLSTYLLKIYF